MIAVHKHLEGMKKHEELVEEIENEYLGRFWRLGAGGLIVDKTWTRTTTLALITLILSAVRDGLEISGEEARIKDCYISELGGCRDIIALTGTSQGDPVGGKEETCEHCIKAQPAWKICLRTLLSISRTQKACEYFEGTGKEEEA